MRILVALFLLLSACGSSDYRGHPSQCSEPSGGATDLAAEPEYQVDYLFRAQRDGCDVRLDVLTLRRPGSDFHCAPWPSEILMGTPLGSPATSDSTRFFVRDPDQLWGDAALAAGFAVVAEPPDDATRTSYEIDGAQLWMVPADDSYIYLEYADHTEQWPRARTPSGCA